MPEGQKPTDPETQSASEAQAQAGPDAEVEAEVEAGSGSGKGSDLVTLFIGAAFWGSILAFAAWRNEAGKAFMIQYRWQLATLVLVLILLSLIRPLRRRLGEQSANVRAAIMVFVAVPAIVLFFWGFLSLLAEHRATTLRVIFLMAVCILPATLYYLFVSTRRYSLLNEFLSNLQRLGLRKARPGETENDFQTRLRSYLQKFEALYGSLPEEHWIEKFLGRPRDFTSEDDHGTDLAGLFSAQISTPVILTTILIILGWIWTLPPWAVPLEETTVARVEVVGPNNAGAADPDAVATDLPSASDSLGAAVGAEPAASPPQADEEGPGATALETPTAEPDTSAVEGVTVEETAANRLGSSRILAAGFTSQEAGTPGATADDQEKDEKKGFFKRLMFWKNDDEEADTGDSEGGSEADATPLEDAVSRAAEDAAAPPSNAEDSDSEAAATDPATLRRQWLAALTPERTPVHFAFLGAYFFSIQLLFRRFVRRDLGTSAYVAFSLRIVLAVIGIWIIKEAVGVLPGQFGEGVKLEHLMVIGFIVGAFPQVVWHSILSISRRFFGFFLPQFRSDLPLSDLDGVNMWHEARLEEEDIENIPSMATTDIVELLLHTRFPAHRIVDWIDQAILYTHLGKPEGKKGEDSRAKLRRHGIYTATSLIRTHEASGKAGDQADFEKILPAHARSTVRTLVNAVKTNANLELVEQWKASTQKGTA